MSWLAAVHIIVLLRPENAGVIDCVGEDKCRGETLDCINGEPCEVKCGDFADYQNVNYACYEATINCPEIGDCDIQCGADYQSVCQSAGTIVKWMPSIWHQMPEL